MCVENLFSRSPGAFFNGFSILRRSLSACIAAEKPFFCCSFLFVCVASFDFEHETLATVLDGMRQIRNAT